MRAAYVYKHEASMKNCYTVITLITKMRIFIIIGIALVVGAFGYIIFSGPSESESSVQQSSASNTTASSNNPSQSTESTESTSTPGVYTEYTAEKLASTTGQKVLFFHASWCPQCRSIEKGITPSEIPTGTTIFKVDYDTNQDLRKKYGVTLQTTFVVVDDNLNLVKKHVGYDQPTFDAVKKAIF